MGRCCTAALLVAVLTAVGWADDKAAGKGGARKLPPALAAIVNGTAEDFINRFDKNKDGVVSRDELPPRMSRVFDRADTNGDGKLDRDEVERMLQVLRRRFGAGNGTDTTPRQAAAGGGGVEQAVHRILERMDTNHDGQISRDEAQGPLAKNFDRLDANKDGYLDGAELRRAVSRFMKNRNNSPRAGTGGRQGRRADAPAPAVDFDALDANADGRLTREELRGTRFAEHFDEIDTNRDGKIDPQEFGAYLKKQAATGTGVKHER